MSNNNDLLETIQADGSVVSSSQFRFSDVDGYRNASIPMEGIIVDVVPSDDPNNLTSSAVSSKRGFRHECTVLVIDDYGSSYLLLENVVIPPNKHSGVDDFEEDLPRGVSGHVDKQQLNKHWKNIDISRLDGEHCVVSFIGGCLDKPFISNWWPHPANNFDLSTSGQTCLKQADSKKNQSRAMRRVNGVLQLITKEGDVYFDTNEASSTVDITSEKGTTSGYRRKLSAKGGNVQVNIKKNKQLEINWNDPVEGLGAGSTSASQDREVDLPHVDHAKALAAYTPPKRDITKTFVRFNQNEILEKTNNWTVNCGTVDDKKGEALILADESINLYVRNGDNPVNVIHMEDNKIQLITRSGTQIDLMEDEISILTKSGGFIHVNGTKIAVAGQVDISGPVAVGGITGQPTLLGTTFSTLEQQYLQAEAQFGKDAAALFTALAGVCTVPPITPMAAKFNDLATAFSKFTAAALALNIAMPTMMAKNLTTS